MFHTTLSTCGAASAGFVLDDNRNDLLMVSCPLPPQAEWDDVQTHWLRRVPIQSFPALVSDAADQLLGEEGGRVLGIGLHPWMIGAPHRIRYLREALERVVGRPGLLPATAGQVAAWFREAA